MRRFRWLLVVGALGLLFAGLAVSVPGQQVPLEQRDLFYGIAHHADSVRSRGGPLIFDSDSFRGTPVGNLFDVDSLKSAATDLESQLDRRVRFLPRSEFLVPAPGVGKIVDDGTLIQIRDSSLDPDRQTLTLRIWVNYTFEDEPGFYTINGTLWKVVAERDEATWRIVSIELRGMT